MLINDLTFITNQNGQSLLERFKVLIKDTEFFDCLVGYFYISGFYKLYEPLEKTKQIRILIGIDTDQQTYDLIKQLYLSNVKVKEIYSRQVIDEIENSQDTQETENGIKLFKEWLKSEKIQIRAYPEKNLHAKLYIMTFTEGDRDRGRIITGSSNFSYSGLVDNLEFNVELKNASDYEFAKEKFNQLWESAIDISEDYINTVIRKTWLRDDITPYELYLKFLYEYFKRDLEETNELYNLELPDDFRDFEYQKQAVLNAKRILEEYGGVFLSDVVGLGKTYMAAMLASQLDGRTLILASPVLIDSTNPGSWPNVFRDFNLKFDAESIGQIKNITGKYNLEKYKNIIIDESHRFRTETTISYEHLSEICRGKRVILVSATPYNNSPKDIFSQIALFQNKRKSTIPGLPNLEGFFNKLEDNLNKINKKENFQEYIKMVEENARQIREKVLKYIMIRRTRSEIEKYFKEDLEKNKLRFPQVNDPQALFYELDEKEDNVFDSTIKLLTQNISYARYTPLLYLKDPKQVTHLELSGQKNMGTFMKVLLIKRLESSFYAFKLTIKRFVGAYKKFIKEFSKGNVYLSKKYSNKIFEYIEEENDEAIQSLIDQDKAQKYSKEEFVEDFGNKLANDYRTLCQIKRMWDGIKNDPKIKKLITELATNKILKNKKVIIFTESQETARYLKDKIEESQNDKVLVFSSSSSEDIKKTVIENFDAKVKNKKDEYRILVSTDILSEGVNLHRSNIIINYDIPWNPTKMMQRAGRINRIDTKFSDLYVFNFFPTRQSNDQIQLQEIAQAKINAFLTLLGDDAAVLTEDEPIGSHELFGKLTSKSTITGEDDPENSELKYLSLIQDIRKNNTVLFEKIKKLPKKARSVKYCKQQDFLVTYLRKGKIEKFYCAKDNESNEIDFIETAKLLESTVDEKRPSMPIKDFFDLLNLNKDKFSNAVETQDENSSKMGRDKSKEVMKYLKFINSKRASLTDTQEDFVRKLKKKLEEGAIPKGILSTIIKSVEILKKQASDPLKLLGSIQHAVPERLLMDHYAQNSFENESYKTEVILSMYFKRGLNE
ncbi:Superfamily 2 DNA/RNA helicase, SNF2 family [Desulfurella amilsii]|uniref:Superfamily 2 DNA/RNA helicase, SNF2 family n=1 Tax=Desulfurella amilsii TaxID=1562698 RepID=A0A1X4Y070_9BACT|nr:helicase-related protein [Desulfurella amilsii]OSS43164.1 Superfamily 2 DNA/RNA helicase, SNF2 family [Desulfurella amilsii]